MSNDSATVVSTVRVPVGTDGTMLQEFSAQVLNEKMRLIEKDVFIHRVNFRISNTEFIAEIRGSV